MKIARILAYRVELPLHETTYKWSGGKSVTIFDSTIVRVETDADGHAPYEAHMTDADGNPVTVYVDDAFNVVSVETR